MRLVRSFLAFTLVSGSLFGSLVTLSGCSEEAKTETKIPVATEAQKAQSNADAAAHKSDKQPPRK